MKNLLISYLVILFPFLVKAQDFALKQLENSPRHHEWIKVKANNKNVHCFVVYPEKAKNTTAVIIIHENRGLTDWVRSFADQMAEKGYLAIAPDLLSEFSDTKSKTSDFASTDDAKKALYQLRPEGVTQDLNAVYNYISKLPASNGKVATMGFCWGGSQTFRFVTNNSKIKAAMVFYGRAPKDENKLNTISAPVYGFYGGDDQRINATIEGTEKAMKQKSKTYDYEIYKGAGHAFMRRGDDPQGSKQNKKAKKTSWKRIVNILEGL